MVNLKAHRVLGMDVETRRKGSDWGDGRFSFKDFFCGYMKFDHAKTGSWSGFFPDPEAFITWTNMLRLPDIIICAHNAKYDMSVVSGELVRLGERPLDPVLVCDTLKDGPNRGKMAYGTLNSMCAQYGVSAKGSISQFEWDQAYGGNAEVRKLVKEYNIGDVTCVLELRKAMLELGHLKAPRVWKP